MVASVEPVCWTLTICLGAIGCRRLVTPACRGRTRAGRYHKRRLGTQHLVHAGPGFWRLMSHAAVPALTRSRGGPRRGRANRSAGLAPAARFAPGPRAAAGGGMPGPLPTRDETPL